MSGFPKNRVRKANGVPEAEEPNGRGRPEYVPTKEERKVVFLAASVGVPQDKMAEMLNDGHGIAKMTLQKHFRRELHEGMWKANMDAIGSLYDTMMHCPDPKTKLRATEFWLERRMGWIVKQIAEHEPSKLVISVEGGLPKLEHTGNGIDLEHVDAEDTD